MNPLDIDYSRRLSPEAALAYLDELVEKAGVYRQELLDRANVSRATIAFWRRGCFPLPLTIARLEIAAKSIIAEAEKGKK